MHGMLERMSWSQFVEWYAFHSIEPFGEQRADTRSALISSILANVNRDPKKRPRPFSYRDFMLFPPEGSRTRPAHGPRQPVTSGSDWASIKRMAAVLAGGRD